MNITVFFKFLNCRKSTIYKNFLRISVNFSYLKRPESHLVMMKLDTPQFRSIFTPEVNCLSDMFKKYNYGLRMAGGAVRDLLMNKLPEDIDFATTATPTQMKEMFSTEGIRMLHRKGEAHGTVTVRINDKQNFEVTTLRVDMKTDGRHAEVEFTTDWELDAGRRDLTINAMFLGLDGTLYDYFNGRVDLENRKVRFVGDPESRIQEDYLRILRYFRFYGRIAVNSDSHDAETIEAIERNAEGLAKISGERIWMELRKILVGHFAKEIVLRMINLKIGQSIGLPANPNIVEFETTCNRSQGMNPHYMTLLTALLENEEEVLALHSRMKFSKYERDLALFLVNNRSQNYSSLHPLFSLILNTKGKTSDMQEWCCELLKYSGSASLYKDLSNWKIPKFPVNGHLLSEKGYNPGPKMTKIMSKLKEIWIESNFQMSKEELLDYLEKTKDN